jgi:hypothetical protein
MAPPKVKADSRNVPIPDKIQALRGVLVKVTGNANFPIVQETLPALKAAVDLLETTYLDAQGARYGQSQDSDPKSKGDGA